MDHANRKRIENAERDALESELSGIALAYGMSADGKRKLVELVLNFLTTP